jgi:hypothetical protein
MAPGFSRRASPLWKEISSTARKQACISDLEGYDKWGNKWEPVWEGLGATLESARGCYEVVIKDGSLGERIDTGV